MSERSSVDEGLSPSVTGVDLLALVRGLAESARGSELIEAFALRTRDVDVKVFGGEVESLAVAGVAGVGVRVVVDGRQGLAYAGTLDADVIEETLAEARDNASFGTPDEHLGVASLDDVAGVVAPELDLWDDAVASTSTDEKVAIALALDRAARAIDPRVRGVESSTYGDAMVEHAVATNLGIAMAARRTVSSCSTYVLAGEGSGTQTGGGFSAGRAPGDLDVERAAREAVERAVRMLGARQVPSQHLPVVLDPLVTRTLLALLGSALSGEAIVKGRSLFVGREGETVAAPHVTLVDDPTLPEAFGATTHDAEGIPTRRVELIADGRLDGFLDNVTTARRRGTRTTGSAVRGGFSSAAGVGARALHLRPGTLSPEEILASVPEALYVQSVSGIHSGTNTVSGDFSVGAEGLMVRGGTLAEPVREVTIASTLQRMLQEIVHVGADLEWLPGGAAGMTLLIGDMSIAGS